MAELDKHLFDDCSSEVQLYIEGLEQMLAENATTINQHEELLDAQRDEIINLKEKIEFLKEDFEDVTSTVKEQDEEIQRLQHEIDSLEYSISNERCL